MTASLTPQRTPPALQLVALTRMSKLVVSILRTRDEEGEHKGDTLGRAIASLHRCPPLTTHATATGIEGEKHEDPTETLWGGLLGSHQQRLPCYTSASGWVEASTPSDGRRRV